MLTSQPFSAGFQDKGYKMGNKKGHRKNLMACVLIYCECLILSDCFQIPH